MDAPTPSASSAAAGELDMEVWRDAWERENAQRPPQLRFAFPDQTVFRSATEVRKIVRFLNEHGIYCCVVGVMALRYYGAARLCTTIEVCVPTEKLAVADALISKGTDNASYTAWRGHQPDLEVHRCSLYHTFPRYRLNHEGPEFDFYLVPSEDWRLDCVPENFEYSAQQQIPYPKLHLFAQSLLERLEINDLQDLVDGMDITEEWGEQHLQLDSPGKEYAQWVAAKNAKIRAALPQRIRDDPLNQMCGPGMYDMDEEFVAFRDVFAHIVRTKEPRARLQFPCGTYATKYRAKGSPDPRTTIRFHV